MAHASRHHAARALTALCLGATGTTILSAAPAHADDAVDKAETRVNGIAYDRKVAVKKDRSLAFVALGPANRVAVVDARSFAVLDYLLVGQRVWQLAFSPDERYLFTTNGVSNDVTVIDVEQRRPLKSIPTGPFPWGVAVKD